MNVSIAMTTYNGCKYIIEQLDSIRLQTRKVDEVIIADDGSQDKTVSIIRSYIDNYNLNKWSIYVNQTNLGWKDNFHSVIEKTTGDIVFFSDQDDIWCNDKIDQMVQVFESNQKVNVLCCKAAYINSDGNNINIPYKVLPFGIDKKKLFRLNQLNNKFIYTIMPGCTMAVTRKFINQLTYKERLFLPHDALYWKIGTLTKSAYLLNIELIKYRIHETNASKPNVHNVYYITTKDTRRAESQKNLQEMIAVYQLLDLISFGNTYKHSQKFINKLIDFCNWRIKLITNKPSARIILELTQNYKYYRCLKMFLGDILSSLF